MSAVPGHNHRGRKPHGYRVLSQTFGTSSKAREALMTERIADDNGGEREHGQPDFPGQFPESRAGLRRVLDERRREHGTEATPSTAEVDAMALGVPTNQVLDLRDFLDDASAGPWRPERPVDTVAFEERPSDVPALWLTNDAGDLLKVDGETAALLVNAALPVTEPEQPVVAVPLRAALEPSMVAEARLGLRNAEKCDMNRGSARLCGACAATLVYLARLVVEAADSAALAVEAVRPETPEDAKTRAAAEADPWSFKEGTLLERLEWCRWQHQIGADLSAQGQSFPPKSPPENARWHLDCVAWYDGMIRDLKANENLR